MGSINGSAIQTRGIVLRLHSCTRTQANGADVLFEGYRATLDALVALTVAQSESIYQLQLIVLVLEGGLLCILMCSYMWMASHQVSS